MPELLLILAIGFIGALLAIAAFFALDWALCRLELIPPENRFFRRFWTSPPNTPRR